MSIILAGFIAIAIAAAIPSPRNEVTPDAQCLADAQADALKLQPFASELAGQNLPVQVIADQVSFYIRMVEERGVTRVLATANSKSEIAIYPPFCDLLPDFQHALIAHELGHLVDFSLDKTPVVFRREFFYVSWNERPAEKIADRYGKEILRLSGGEPANIDLLGIGK